MALRLAMKKSADLITIFVCGDVMLGRGVDQILAHPGDPALHEPIGDARAYIRLAEERNGPIPAPVEDAWPWGAATPILDQFGPDMRLLNLETAITTDGHFAALKPVQYQMNRANLGALAVIRPDVCALANNHVLDFGLAGLQSTIAALGDAGIVGVGAGANLVAARRPAVVSAPTGHRVLVASVASQSSGVPRSWAAGPDRPGIWLAPNMSNHTAARIAEHVCAPKREGDLAVVSIHWGPNWGYGVDTSETRFAHRLIDGGVDIVHGHSSHHPRPIEIYRGKPILYGCGDLINDYEGIRGYESYRTDLRLLYLVSMDAAARELVELRMIPLQARRMRLERASTADAQWLRATLDRISLRLHTWVTCDTENTLTIRW